MKNFKDMYIAKEEIVKYTVVFHLNGVVTEASYHSLYEVLDYLDDLVEQGGTVANVLISQERNIILE